MATKKRKKPTTKLDRAVDRLYKAVDFYVRAKGGSLVIVGGIQIQEWPGDPVGKFTVGVQCLGRKPEFPAQNCQHPNVAGDPGFASNVAYRCRDCGKEFPA